MPRYVIDTNVPIVANGRDEADNITVDCQRAAVELLQDALNQGRVFLDSAGEIQAEYAHYLHPKGQPGVGDRFYLEVINSHPQRVVRLDVIKRPDGEYENLPQELIDSGFDRSDRKFAAVARRARARVCNAVDRDWVDHKAIIKECDIEVLFLCGCDPRLWRYQD